MEVILTAVEGALADAWKLFCGDLECVTVHRGSIFEVACDAVVSPANSFGFMNGGIDALYVKHFGAGIQDKVQEMIAKRHHGELLVGTADLVETGDQSMPYLIAAPTMRVPMVLTDSVNAYLAARAVFLLVKNGCFPSGDPVRQRVQRVAFPGLGTGVGQLGVNTCAHQMRVAIEEGLLGRATPPRSWAEASERHQLLYTPRVKRLQ